MYDRVSGQLFGNAGSGSFTVGNDVVGVIEPHGNVPQNPYVSDGLVGWWDGIWNIGLGCHGDSPHLWKNLVGSNGIFSRATSGSMTN
jgi:hypothetical protein